MNALIMPVPRIASAACIFLVLLLAYLQSLA